jgi:hypothetical protein
VITFPDEKNRPNPAGHSQALQIARRYVSQQLAHEPDVQRFWLIRPHVKVELQGAEYAIATRPILEGMGAEVVRGYTVVHNHFEAYLCRLHEDPGAAA